MSWEPIGQPGVKILHIEPQTILVVVKLVAAPKNICRARQLGGEVLIEHVDLHIGGCQDCSSLNPVSVLNISCQVGEDGLTELLHSLPLRVAVILAVWSDDGGNHLLRNGDLVHLTITNGECPVVKLLELLVT